VGEPEGLVPSVANFDNIHVVAKHLLSSRVGALSVAREREVKRALGYALDWAELKIL
jgi:mRNA-degrading endonuclease toxin of MazEF toxin-antitoxin module